MFETEVCGPCFGLEIEVGHSAPLPPVAAPLLAKLFSSEFCKIFTNSFFYRTPPVAASEAWEFELSILL